MSHKPQGKIRIIGGEWKGRKLSVLDVEGLRPTPDRVRETLFNWLQDRVSGARCLDLFAGTGALGFEAASRGAAQVLMVEQQRPLHDQIDQNIKTLRAENIQLIKADTLQWLQSHADKYDLVFLDPPFSRNMIDAACKALLENDLLLSDARIYIESEPEYPVPQGFIMEKQGQAGKVKYRLIKLQD